MQALAGITVLDFTTGIAGPYATKMLADYGANVIKVEPPGGDVARTYPPFAGDEPHRERSGIFLYLNTNKRSIVLDPRRPADREVIAQLAATADIVVESFGPALSEELGLGWDFFHAIKPDLSLISISDFGLDGPYKDYKLSELTLYAFAGAMYSMGLLDREPVKMAGTAALIECGTAITSALLAAVYGQRKHGFGQHVDISLADIQFQSCDRRSQTMITWQFSGFKTLRGVLNARGTPSGIYPCADGQIDFTSGGARPDRLADMLGYPDWLKDPDFLDPARAKLPEVVERWNEHFFEWCIARTRSEIWFEARRAGVLCGPMFDPSDQIPDPVYNERGFWAQMDHPEVGKVTVPGRQFRLEADGYAINRPAPMLDEHKQEILAGLRTPAPLAAFAPAPGVIDETAMPLKGVRVVDLTVVIAGTYGTLVLADLGAEVIKVENASFMQPMTRSMARTPSQDPLTLSAYPDAKTGARPWNYWATHVSMYRNKKSMTVDFRRPEGLEVLRQLIAKSDIVAENNSVDMLQKFGITYEWMREANPNIIFVRLPAFGLTGAYSNARALGWHIEAVAGHTLQRGYDDHDVSANHNIYAGDFMAGLNLSAAALTALLQREHTGHGQMVEVTQVEGDIPMIAHAVMDFSLNGRVQTPIGNRDIHDRYPCGVYPAQSPGTSATGDDHWIAIHVQSDGEWDAFREVIGDPEWARDERFATNAGRKEHYREIDAHIANWTRDRDDYEMMHLLQAHGVSAAPVLEASRMLDVPQLRARNFLRPQRIDTGQTYDFCGPMYLFKTTPIEFFQDPVTLGEHNDDVYRNVLELSEEQYQALKDAGHIATEFDASIP
ncbi:hypothetical protein AYO38_01360 [bacterium SCGC AG-212-C10]|nr:hypothetical protein AYO38_01360 [bacterium SCGC AG-212-C10]